MTIVSGIDGGNKQKRLSLNLTVMILEQSRKYMFIFDLILNKTIAFYTVVYKAVTLKL